MSDIPKHPTLVAVQRSEDLTEVEFQVFVSFADQHMVWIDEPHHSSRDMNRKAQDLADRFGLPCEPYHEADDVFR